jgi:hypothetical protein
MNAFFQANREAPALAEASREPGTKPIVAPMVAARMASRRVMRLMAVGSPGKTDRCRPTLSHS